MNKLHTGENIVSILKSLPSSKSLSLVIPIGDPVIAYLRPIPTLNIRPDDDDINLLTLWRNKYVNSFLTIFVANNTQTYNWLRNYVHNNNGKVLFMIDDIDRKTLGHVGLGFIDWKRKYGEADAIVNGGDAPRGLMKKALLTMLLWAKNVLCLEILAVRVRSDNEAIHFYKKVGFIEKKRVLISPVIDGDEINWIETPEFENKVDSVYLVHMIINLN